MAVLCCARVRRGVGTEVIDVASGCFRGGWGHHQKGADSLRLGLLLTKMMVFCLFAVQWKYVRNSDTKCYMSRWH
jgi:hypothetical protein